MKNKIIIIAILGILPLFSSAQLPFDALRFSMTNPGGTARYLATAGAFGAIGADFSTLSSNPAGIGLFRTTEFTITPGLTYQTASANYGGMITEDDKYRLNIHNAGVVFAFGNRSGKNSNWKRFQFGFGMNQLADFSGNTSIEGDNSYGSILMEYQKKAAGTAPKNLDLYDTKLAWDTYLFPDTFSGTNGMIQYTSAIPNGGVRQMKYIERKGGMNEMVLSLGGNYNDKIYLGGTIGFPTLNYREDASYREVDAGDSIPTFKSLTINDYLNTSGSGINFKFGIIARPVDWIRIGGAIHTPTFFSLHDEYSRSMKHRNDLGQELYASSPTGYYDYNLRTPMRAIVSLGFIIGKYGFIGIDYEAVDYSDARFETKNDHFTDVNRVIREDYREASNLRIGGELNLNPIRLRAGYALYGSPYTNGLNDFEKSTLAFGLGFKDKNYFLDFSWVMTSYGENYYLYDPEMVLPAQIDNLSTGMIMTLGFKL